MYKSVTYEVVGDQKIICEGCEHRIESALKHLPGVGKVRVNGRNQHIDVLLDRAVLEPSAVAERLREVGYETRVRG